VVHGQRAALDPPAGRIQLAWSGIGMLTVMVLVYIEIVQLGVVCIWCSAAHLLVLTIFLVALMRANGGRVKR